jgi:hypothetical protein
LGERVGSRISLQAESEWEGEREARPRHDGHVGHSDEEEAIRLEDPVPFSQSGLQGAVTERDVLEGVGAVDRVHRAVGEVLPRLPEEGEG